MVEPRIAAAVGAQPAAVGDGELESRIYMLESQNGAQRVATSRLCSCCRAVSITKNKTARTSTKLHHGILKTYE